MGSNKRAGSASKVRIDKFEDLFGGSAEQESSAEQIINAPLTDLHTFKDHPFRVEDDEKMEETTESIRQYGVLVPGIARPREGGGYEIIAGHRRKRGSELAGKKEMPVIVRNYTDDEATIIMVDSNIQREDILPSEKARAYPVTGEETEEEYEYEEEEEYEVSILRVTLTVIPLESLVSGKMDTEQAEIFAMYGETNGLLQEFASPLNLYWYYYVSSYYGYRKNEVTGNEEFHRGVDIAVPTGTTVYAAHDGMVTAAAYDSHYGNYVAIEIDGYTTKYAHMDSLSVSAGQTVEKGAVIGTTGNTGSSTGSHLHIECLYNGEYYNPLFYFDVGEGTLYGETPGGLPGNAIPPDAYDDASVQALMEEAAKYLGFPYVWGGSSPSTSFDCSGFVCWVFTNSGVHNLPRTTAQGIYDQCTPVSASDAKAGDIIFFTGTYNSAGAVSHVGIYCGNGTMIHCGDPISYASINSPYWQSHFYAFGRLN